MKITVIGTGYVGLIQAACMAELGNTVVGLDVDEKKIEMLKKGKSPIYEPGIEDLLSRNIKEGRLSFTTSYAEAIPTAEVVFIAVGTPSTDDGRADLQYVEASARSIAQHLKKYTVVVNKSTVPVGTGDVVSDIIRKELVTRGISKSPLPPLSERGELPPSQRGIEGDLDQSWDGTFDVASNPEFLREGSAIHDFLEPDRVVIGDASERARTLLETLYQPLNAPILFTDIQTAEMIKYASNAMLATQISFINSIAQICEKVGADVTKVAAGMRLDGRIGKRSFLDAGVGYGGSCFPKDVKALIQIAHDHGVHFEILESVEDVNAMQLRTTVEKIRSLVGESFKGKRIALWGLAFKPKTDDIRDAPAMAIATALISEGATVVGYDPVAANAAKRELPGLEIAGSAIDAVKDADALAIMTEWDELKEIDLTAVVAALKQPNIVDGRNLYELDMIRKLGVNYRSIGRPAISS